MEALRIEAWRPRLGPDTDDRTVPHELDWLRTAVHLAKGCYKGQETVARVHNLGKSPRRLVLLMAAATGLAVASNYYAQPLLETLAQAFQIQVRTAGAVVTLFSSATESTHS